MNVPSAEERAIWGSAPLRSPLLPAVPVAPVRVFIAYDDLAAGRRAMDLLGQLGADCGGMADLQPAFWRFDVLDNDACRESAANDAEAAEVIMIGMSHAENSGEIDRWLEQALVRRQICSVAIVALVTASSAPAAGTEERLGALAAIAARHGADFFVNEPKHEFAASTIYSKLPEEVTPPATVGGGGTAPFFARQ